MKAWKHVYTCERCFGKHEMRVRDYENAAKRGLVVCRGCTVAMARVHTLR